MMHHFLTPPASGSWAVLCGGRYVATQRLYGSTKSAQCHGMFASSQESWHIHLIDLESTVHQGTTVRTSVFLIVLRGSRWSEDYMDSTADSVRQALSDGG